MWCNNWNIFDNHTWKNSNDNYLPDPKHPGVTLNVAQLVYELVLHSWIYSSNFKSTWGLARGKSPIKLDIQINDVMGPCCMQNNIIRFYDIIRNKRVEVEEHNFFLSKTCMIL